MLPAPLAAVSNSTRPARKQGRTDICVCMQGADQDECPARRQVLPSCHQSHSLQVYKVGEVKLRSLCDCMMSWLRNVSHPADSSCRCYVSNVSRCISHTFCDALVLLIDWAHAKSVLLRTKCPDMYSPRPLAAAVQSLPRFAVRSMCVVSF
jgi:hypothetical protein